MVQSQLTMYPSDFRYDGRFPVDLTALPSWSVPDTPVPWVDIRDARPLQAAATSQSAFFEDYGFVLIDQATQVTDWDTDQPAYATEVEALIRATLFPGHQVLVMRQGAVLFRRGRDTPTPYAVAVHQDYGLDADDFQQMLGAFAGLQAATVWRERYDDATIEGYMMLDFWRPTNMAEPLRHMPLAVCDPRSVDMDDIVPVSLTGIAPNRAAVNQMSLRRNPNQSWYYYPEMTVNEVLVFKLFDRRKSDGATPLLRSVFHSAFEDPTTPEGAEIRQSSEFRISLYMMAPR